MKNKELYEDWLLDDMNDYKEMDRREFMKKIGGGLVIGFTLSNVALATGYASARDDKPNVNAYLRIGGEGRITLFTGKIDMGQGANTSLPMMLADELDVDIVKIDIVMGDTDLCPWDNGTHGSLSIRRFGQGELRPAAAKARAILIKMASDELSIEADQLEVENGVIYSKENRKINISYADLTNGKEILESIGGEFQLKKAAEFKVMGTSRLHADAYAKVTGQAMYAGDIQMPGLLRARILRPPSVGAKLLNVDTRRAEDMEGVQVIRHEDMVAVLHESQDMADIAISKIKAEFETDKTAVNDSNLYEYLLNCKHESKNISSGGDLASGKKKSAKLFDMEYHDPYLAHATIETHSSTAVFEDEKLKIWTSTQSPWGTRENIAEELGIPEDDIRVMQIFLGGGFGGKSSNPQAVEAALLAKLSGKPVQVIYTRQEEFLSDRFRPAAVIKLKSGLNDEGMIALWDYRIFFGGRRGARHFYDIPNHSTQIFSSPRGLQGHVFSTGAWRGPSANTNTFARESQMDIMASAAGTDPLEFRLKHLKGNQKMAELLKAAAEKFGWTPAKGPSGRGYGFACGEDANTLVTVFVEVEVNEETGHIQVKRAVCAQNMGLVVNPQGAIIQAEGCIIMGLGYALSEEMRFEGKKLQVRNFDSYTIPQFSWVPQIEVILIDAKEDPPQGGGEPAIICMGGAIANAVFDASGARLTQLPMTPDRVLQAL